MAEEKSNMHSTLMKRHQERLENFEARRQARLKIKLETNENSEAFIQSFNKKKREITLMLNSLDETQIKLDLTSSFNNITLKLQTLQKFLSDSLSFLPGYDMRRAQEILKQLRDDVAEKRDLLLPKKKFAFKSRQKLLVSQNDKNNSADSVDLERKQEKKFPVKGNVGFSDRCNETLTLLESDCQSKDLYLSNLSDCTVYIYGYPSAVRIEKVINTEIYCGPVSRSIFINDSFDSVFHLACQQLRIHATGNTKFYIHVTSKAIIEDCEELGFGCYSWSYDTITEHFEKSGLDKYTNNWQKVDDFNWLKLDERSPNWYMIDTNQ